jgi:ribosomal protein L5
MPTVYKLKTSPMDRNRIEKVCKKVIDDSTEDRKLALEAHRFFRQMVDENPQDASAKSLMVDCLKLAQTSKTNTIKIVDLLVKMEAAVAKGDKGDADSLYAQLDTLS